MERYDIIIVGTGPAGLSAAITAKIRNKKILLIGSKDLSFKIEKASKIENYLGLPAIDGKSLRQNFRSHLESLNIDILDAKVNAVYSMGDYFSLLVNNDIYEATSVIIATGVSAVKLLPGEENLLGRGVSYCATCDARLYSGKNVAVIAYNKNEEKEAEFLAEVVNHVFYIPIYKDEISFNNDNITILRDIPVELKEDGSLKFIVFKNNNDLQVDGIFILRESSITSQLVPGIQINDNSILVNKHMETNIAGCFAAGDITGKPYQYMKSAGEGNVAALSAVEYINNNKEIN